MGINKLLHELNQRNIIITALLMLASIIFYRYALPDAYLYTTILIYFILTFVLKIDSRLPIAGALVFLVMTPFFLIKNLESYANYLATLAYFLLVIGVVKQFFEYLRERKRDKGS